MENNKDAAEFSRWEKAIQIAVSITGFLSLLISVKIWQDSDKRQVSQAAISLFEKFRDERFAKIRSEAWIKRNKYYYEEGYREKIIDASAKIEEEYKYNFLMQEMRVVRDLIEFYTVLSEYKGCEEIIKKCRYFHYGYWRHFLYEIAELHDNYNLPVSTFEEFYDSEYKKYVVGISYVATLKRMDRLVGFENIPENFKFHEFK
ncbi:hypothetical protein GCM10028808_40240 [Spirosoma migulaei]